MNAGKRGHTFQYPDLFIQWMASIYLSLHVPYRQMEGFTRKLSLRSGTPVCRLCHPVSVGFGISTSLQVNPEILSRDVIVVVDPTGIKVTNRGE